MVYAVLKVPIKDAKEYLESEINSYAYDTNKHALVFLEQFFYDTNGNISVKTQMFQIEDDDDLVKEFVVDNPAIPGLKFMKNDCPTNEDLMLAWVKITNEKLNKLVEFRESTNSSSIDLPVFEIGQIDDSEIVSPRSPMDKISPDDIPVDIPNNPMDFGYSPEMDQEVL